MSPKKAFDNGKWVFWLVGFLASALFTLACLWSRSASASIAANTNEITKVTERTGKLETHIEYIRDGVKRLEHKFETHPKAKE